MIQAARLSLILTPRIAKGAPLRALSLLGIDSKFFERHRQLIIRLLDIQHHGLISDTGLENFLDAAKDLNHWLLLVDMDGGLLPFKQQRVRDDELGHASLPGNRVLIVENEKCLHLIPPCKDTIAICGAGFNLAWMTNPELRGKSIAYWGDIDTWGLLLLAKARRHRPDLIALLMDTNTYEHCHARSAVEEPVTAGSAIPENLTAHEEALYRRLLGEPRGGWNRNFCRNR